MELIHKSSPSTSYIVIQILFCMTLSVYFDAHFLNWQRNVKSVLFISYFDDFFMILKKYMFFFVFSLEISLSAGKSKGLNADLCFICQLY